MENLIDSFGEGRILFGFAVLIGMVFGAAAQHSRFCLRAATIEFSHNIWGPRIAIWFVAFSAAVLTVQLAIVLGHLDLSDARQIAAQGSLSGAILGGALFGSGMILARGCASRLLVLSATGNLRAIVTGLVLTLTAQASLRGVLSPLRESLSAIWTVEGGPSRDLLVYIGISPLSAAVIAGVCVLLAIAFAAYRGKEKSRIFAAVLVGAAISAGWMATYSVAQNSFEVVPVSSITFTGPSADTLMGFVNERQLPLSFGSGLVPGVFLGAFLMAWLSKEAKIQRFEPQMPMERYLLGGVMMGFGSMLAGGCAVGAGMSGGAIFALTAWLALLSMWVGAVLTQRISEAGLGGGIARPRAQS
ncbi:YeeE/YedE family protein [Sulfitobacter sp. M57]|uniref:YeeE/YedE family protein n=1 Tax=unclassified Sulfitobacter TaxID=196795 RepID=UPI0023E29A98|nr:MULTISPECIES: YeeE/YedE family protein [unclassified Sulfitobacter]MDF3415973.1 YeeE/YedE family protein [Sulfitobacter sp. KE5]MDF3423453.1 YeeE/YedE family protein [Sulfitobacter sp. KE43]MDF3434519.1 YeeE/YedE family protein [Sulfitobacter sp. KE42]MDF3460159.1 YeeE/YedE family protein [Sulfitobacter sp. S74]MDF3464057.1 YeeE/YedE family protein [Sulfitobacter sp. Ks18]